MRMNQLLHKVLRTLGMLVLPVIMTAQVKAEGPTLSGFVDFGYNYNFNGRLTNGYRVFDDRANSLTLQNAEVVVSGKSDKDVAYRVDINYGYDASKIHPAGYGSTDQIDIQQAYLSKTCPVTGVVATFGKFVTLHGAEVIEAKDDWNISRGLLFGYAIPFTHTGIKLDKAFGNLALTAGIVNGWDNLQDNNKGKSFHGGAMYTASPKLMASLGGSYGPEQASTVFASSATNVNQNGRGVVDALLKFAPTDKLTLIANMDWGFEEGLSFTPASADDTTANWTGLALHANYMVNDVWSVAGRFETFDDDRLQADMDGNGSVDEVKLNSLTFTLQHKMNDVISRLEYRMDSSSEKVFFDDKNMPDDGQATIGYQVIYAF